MTKMQAGWLAGLFLLVYVAPLGIRPMFIPDETRYAEIPREMRASGDWVVPRFNGWDYFEKPVLGYWLIAASQEVLGETPFAVRLPSALAAGVSALAILLLMRRRKDASPGFAVALFLAAPLVYLCGTFAVLDGPFSAFVALALVLYFCGDQAESPGRRRWCHAGFGLACGLAFLTKGLLGLVLPVLVIVPYLLWRRKARDLLRLPWMPLAVAAAVILPWAMAVHHRAPDFWRYFIWHEHIQRFLDPGTAQHPEPFWYFIPVLAGGALPLMVLLPSAVAGLRRIGKTPLVMFCLLWVAMHFLFFSASSGKLGTYILPCLPPLAVLVALGAVEFLKAGETRRFDVAARGLGTLVLIALWGFAALHILPFPPAWRVYAWSEVGVFALGAVAVVAFGGALWGSAMAREPLRKLACFAAAPVLVLACFPLVFPVQALRGNAPLHLLARNAGQVKADTLILTTPHYVGAVNWCFKRADAWLLRGAGELTYGLERAPDDRRFVPLEEMGNFVAGKVGEGGLVLFVSERAYSQYQVDLPPPRYIDRAAGFVFVQY